MRSGKPCLTEFRFIELQGKCYVKIGFQLSLSSKQFCIVHVYSFKAVLGILFGPLSITHKVVKMSFIITLIRNLLGGIIAFFDVITRGTKLKRTKEAQLQVVKDTQGLTLYQFFACPFCIKTRRAIYKMNLPIIKRSASKGSPYRKELLLGGGKVQTPCLRIETENGVEWLYESSEIIKYLQQRFT